MPPRRTRRVRESEDEGGTEEPEVRRRRLNDGTPESAESSTRLQILEGYRTLEGEMAMEKAKAARTGDIHIALKNLDAAESLFSKVSGSRNLELFAHDAKAMVSISELAQMSVRNLKFDDSRSLVNLEDVMSSCKKYMLKEYFASNDTSEPVGFMVNGTDEDDSRHPHEDGTEDHEEGSAVGTSSNRLAANTLRRSYLQQFDTYDQFHQFNWFRMGSLFDKLGKSAATVDHLSGPFSLERRPRHLMQPRVTQTDAAAKLTTTQKDLPAPEGSEELTTVLVKRCYEVLKRKKGFEPINLFELVIDPSSYAKSVENLFYISFLLKEGKLVLEEDDEGFPRVRIKEPLPRETSAAELESQRRRDAHQNHIIFQLNGAAWKKLVEKFSISSSFLD